MRQHKQAQGSRQGARVPISLDGRNQLLQAGSTLVRNLFQHAPEIILETHAGLVASNHH